MDGMSMDQTSPRSAAEDVVPTTELQTAASHPVYLRLNQLRRE
jgi:hypothetical protein